MSHTYHRYKIGDEPVPGYRLMDHLGAGGFGEVWKANAPGGTEVALKIIDLTGQQGVQEFASLRVVKKVRHPNLISLQAFWMKDEEGQIVDEAGAHASAAPADLTVTAPSPGASGQSQTADIAMTTRFARPVELIIAMQLGSMSLHRRLEECREQGQAGVPVAELLEYLEQAARGIDFLNKPIHDLGKGPMPIVHGDIKPHNILVVGDAAVVCDFGLARAVETLRKTSMAPVTVAYAAPESFKGKVTPTSDQYSLAITYAELRTGRLPFDETMTPYQVMEAHVTRNLDFSRLPEQEQAVIFRGTEANPEDRWPSSRDLILALRQAVALTGELPLRPGEFAYTGGPTPSHALTGRPMARETGRPTQIPVDPHQETMHPGGRTPAYMPSRLTASSPQGYQSGPLAETALVGPDGTIIMPAKKSHGLWFALAGLTVVAAAVAAVIIVPKLNEKPVANVPRSSAGSQEQPAVTSSNPPSDEETTPADPNSQYIKQVRDKINSGDFAAVVDLLDKAPSKLPGFEKEALQKRLRTAFVGYLDSQVQRRSYGLAMVQLEDASSGIGLSDDDKQKQREKIRTSWLDQSREELKNEEFSKAIETAGNLLKRFPGDRDAQYIIARSQVRLGDNAAAIASLNKLGKTAEQPAEYQPLHAGLLLLAAGSEAAKPADQLKLLDGFLELATLEKGAAPPAALAINAWERDRLTGLRSRLVESVQQMLDSLPANQRKPLLAKLEQLGSSSELQMYKVKSLLDDKQFAEARKSLAEMAAKIPAGNADLKSEAAATRWLIDLRDPATQASDVAKAMTESLALIANVTPAMRNDLCSASEALALGSQAALLESATKLANKTHDLDPGDNETTLRLARLLAAKLALRAAQPGAPKPDEVQTLLQEVDKVEDAKLNNGTIDALHAECLLAQDSRDRQQILELVQRAQPVDAYTQFVQARALRTMPQPNWPQITELLVAAYADPAKLLPAVAAPYRRAASAKLLIEAAAKKRAPPPASAAAVLANPFVDAAAADEAYKLLQLARTLSGDIDAADLKLNDAQNRELLLNLALAAQWKPKPDEALAKSLSDNLIKLNDAELGPNAFPALLTVFRTHRDQAGDQPIAIRAAQRITELFQKQFPVADPDAVALFKEVTQPALALADTQAAAKAPPADLDKFYAAAADFISHYQRALWPFSDKQVEIETLLTKAIARNQKVARYYTSRGVARVSEAPPNIEGALADAADATKIDPNLPAAFALQGHALIYRSRQQPTRDARLSDLDQALAMSTKSVEKSKADDKERSMHLLYVSMAHLERANFETDPKARADHLHKAVDAAQQAIELEKAYPDYAYVALGNALEDLAWLVNEEPEKNFTAAIDAFTHAIDSNLVAAGPWIGRARCFYKSIADVKLDPKFLGRTSEEALQAAISDLEQAKQLQPNLVEPNLWLGKAYQQLGKYPEADAALSDAVRMADEQKLPERAMYLIQWARMPLLNTSVSAEVRGKVVRERAEKLKTAPDIGGSSSAKQASLLIGDSLMSEKKIADALKEYDAALAVYDKLPADKPLDSSKSDGADVSLLLARAYCLLNLPETQWNLTSAEGVFKDAVRIGQLKPGPHLEALADWYAANAKSRSLKSTSSTITAEKKKEFFDGAIADVRKAIETAPTDPGSYEWRAFGTKLLAAKLQVAAANTPPETIKSLGTQARQWIDDAISQAAKRPDLAAQMDGLQRVQQQLDTLLTAKGLPRT